MQKSHLLKLCILLLLVNCSKGNPVDPQQKVPEVQTGALIQLSATAAECGGIIVSNSSSTLWEKGVCWSTSPYPTITNSRTMDGSGTGPYTSNLTDLQQDQTYFARAYATNDAGTGYGEQRSLRMCEIGSMTDIQGNTYRTVKIGKQWWMAENLRVTKFRDNSDLKYASDPAEFNSLRAPAYIYLNNNQDASFAETWGCLYNGLAVISSSGLAPEGWHIPSNYEWEQLLAHIGLHSVNLAENAWSGLNQGGALKEAESARWNPPNAAATNITGFTALGTGFAEAGRFVGFREQTYFWSSTRST